PTPAPSTNTPQKHLPFSSPAPRSVPAMGSVPGMINFDSPAALGLSLEGAMGGVGMGISMSGMGMSALGLSASAIGRADDEERRRRLETVIATLKARPGRVSAEGIEWLCKKEGLEVMTETKGPDTMLTILIGNDAMLDIPLKNDEVESASLQLVSDRPDINFASSGSKILLRDLQLRPGVSRINLTLERFSHNLDKLIRMDKLSSSGVNCFQAVFGVYTSLKKLFEHEKKMALAVYSADTANAAIKAEREVLCKKSGRPRMNAGDSLGLALEYWMDHRHIIPKSKSTSFEKDKEAMLIDSGAGSNTDTVEDEDQEVNKTYSILIECESSPSALYAPIRISSSWLSPSIEKHAESSDPDSINLLSSYSQPTPTLDWLDPPPTYLPSSVAPTEHDAMNLDAQPGRLPNIRFVATFNPPLVVPLSVAVTLHQSLGAEIPPDAIRPTTFVGLALRPEEVDPGASGFAGEGTIEVRSERTVLVRKREREQEGNGNGDGKGIQEVEKKHRCSLYIPKTEYARVIEKLPFQHPRQLVEMLPVLRQYAFATSLLENTFKQEKGKEGMQRVGKGSLISPPLTPLTPGQEEALQVDLTLTYAPPAPRLTVRLPHPLSSRPMSAPSADSVPELLDFLLGTTNTTAPSHPPISIAVDVLPNAEVVVSEQNIVQLSEAPESNAGEGEGARRKSEAQQLAEASKKVQKIGRVLDAAGDVGIWGEWVREEVL
ncbi:hypothetical protein GQ43DRAFT_337057, partial [Delitschia confertaspora ATCC 74209]